MGAARTCRDRNRRVDDLSEMEAADNERKQMLDNKIPDNKTIDYVNVRKQQ